MQPHRDKPTEPGVTPGFRYRAFISYSHADAAWARWIHHALETYPIPARLVGQPTPHGPVPARLKPVFRDRDELPTAAELGPALEQALRNSDALIVLCSPNSAKSRWVNEEVLFFKKLGRGHRVFPVIVGGVPGGRGEQECFPPGVRAMVHPDGTVAPDALEPLAADVRPDKDGESLALLKVIAGITGLPLDELRQREAQRRQKRLAVLAGAGLVLTTVMSVLAAVAFQQRAAAIRSEQKAAEEAKRAEANAKLAKAAEAVAVEKGEAARQSLAKSALNLAEAAQREGDGPAMQAALGEVPEDLRDSTWHYLFEQSDTSIARIRTDTTDIRSVAAHPRQPGVFAVADGKNKVSLIEVRTGRRLLEFTPGFAKVDPTLRIAFSADGERIAIGQFGKDGGIAIHSARDGKKLLAWDAPASGQLEFSPDGRLLLQKVYGFGQIHVWDAMEGKRAWSYPKEPGGAVHGVFTPDGQQVVTTQREDNLRLVNAHDGTLVRALPRSRNVIRTLTMHADGTVTVAGDNGTVLRFALRDDKVLADFRAGDRRIDHVAVTPDGARIVTAVGLPDGRQDIRLWDANNGRAVQSLLGGSGRPIGHISVHPLSGELLVCGPNARAWSLTGAPEKWTLAGFANACLAFAGSDDLIFARASSSVSGLLKLQASAPITLWKPADSYYRLPSVSADGHLAAIGPYSDKENDHPILLLRNPGPAVEQVASFKTKFTVQQLHLSPSGDRLVVIGGGNGGLELLDTATGKEPVKLERKDVKKFWDLGWLDGQRLLGLVTAKADRGNADSEERILVWDVATGKILQTATNRTAMDVLAVAPDGKRFAEAGADKKVRIRDAETLAVQQEFRAHDGPITALAWHPNKPILATASADLSIRLWNLDTGRRLEELRGPLATPNALSFSPSGQRLACSALDGVTRIWEPQSLNDKPSAEKATGDWEDLLAPLTPAIVTATGHGWRMEGGALLSPSKADGPLPLPGTLLAPATKRV